MRKIIRSQKGLTLIELLGAITIATIILGVATMLLSSVLQMFNSNSQSYMDKSAMKLTMNTIAAQLSESSQAIYYPHNNELRYKYGNTYKSAIFDNINHDFTIYDFSNNGTGTPDSDEAEFKNGSISIASHSTLYSKKNLLNDNIAIVEFNQSNGIVVPSVPLTNGEIIQIQISFSFSNVRVSGGSNIVQRVEKTSVKLLVDQTLK